MTQKNGTVEFFRDIKQAAAVFNPGSKRLMKFNLNSNKYFTADPSEIEILDRLGYKRGCVKIDGVKVNVEDMTEDEFERVKRAIEIRSQKLGVKPPVIKEDEKVVEDIKAEDEKVVEVPEDIKVELKVEDEKVVEVPEDIKEEDEKPKIKKLSSKLKKEIEG
jgi:hypothetical protein